MAEIELNVLTRQCLKRIETVRSEVLAWQNYRNKKDSKANWQLIEQCPFASDYFDIVGMTNVLDHVRDADICIQNAIRIIKPEGGYFVIGQDLCKEKKVDRISSYNIGIGHPIRLSKKDIDAYVADVFVFKTYYSQGIAP